VPRLPPLNFVPYADLTLLDPVAPAFVTRNHVMMVFDTLLALDANGDAQPQMLAGYTVEEEAKTWKLTLRDGLLFHDGTKVLARDVVASLRRWAVRDAFGQALMDATDELSAPTDKLVQFRLKRPFPLLPQALGKPNPVDGCGDAGAAGEHPARYAAERDARQRAISFLGRSCVSGPINASLARATSMRSSMATSPVKAWPASAPALASRISTGWNG
jgi:ABC-type transport system substrate-binding protein